MCDTDYTIELDNNIDIYSYEIGEKYTATIYGTGDWGGTKTFEFTFVALSHTIVFDANGGTGTMPNAAVGNNPGRYDLPECTFTPQYGYEFDYWTADCEIDKDTGLPVHKQPNQYFSAPYIYNESYVQTITVKAYWKEKAKYSVTLPDNMELVSGIVDNEGKAYKDEVITFKAVDGCSVFGDVKVGDTVLTPDENGIYTMTVTADTTVKAIVLDGNTCYFDESTSTLHLRGNVNKTNVQQYKDTALSVVAEKGTVLPEDSSSLFSYFKNVTSIDLTNANTSSVTDMNGMFCDCHALETLDLSSFNTSRVTDMRGMFEIMQEAESIDNSLTTIYAGKNWNTDSITEYDWVEDEGYGYEFTITYDAYMFENCTQLKGGNGTVYDSTKTDKTYARIDKDGQPGYFTGLYNLTLPEHMEIVTDSENKVGNRYLSGAEVTFKVKTGYGASNVSNGTDTLIPDENGIYTITVTDDTEITADIVAYTPVVINSVDINGITTPTTVYKEIYTSADYTVPASPYLDGYTFSGWKVNDGETLSTPEAVQTAVYDLVKAGTPVTVEVVYEKKVGKHKVYVSAGTLENGKTEFEYDISELVKITAYEGAEGQVFSYWERDGKAVSYNKTYSFYMPDGDVHLSAVYGNVQPAQATGFIENVTANADTRKISFVSVINVPENCTLVKGGLVATKNPDIGEAVTDKNAAFVKLSAKATADTKNLKYTWTKANVGENDIWYVRSYVVFIDTNNVEQTQYSDAVKADLSGRITG